MNLYDDEESLKQEVIYLHSLWYLGPPSQNPIPNPNPIPRSRPNYIPPPDLAVSGNPNHKRSRPDSDLEWPVNEQIQSHPTEWPKFKPFKKIRTLSSEEEEKFAANKLQKDTHGVCRKFFTGEEEESDGDEDERIEFLWKLFEENEKLKEYYVKKKENGEFWCLVCGAIGDKSCRKFKSCLALIQHSLGIYKTDLKSQHRALAKVVCDVLGWDVNNPVASSRKDGAATTSVESDEKPLSVIEVRRVHEP